jgi:hypothetical protein
VTLHSLLNMLQHVLLAALLRGVLLLGVMLIRW